MVTTNARTLDVAKMRFRVGAADLRSVVQQNVALSSARSALLRVQAERLVQRVNLFLALAGSFESRPAASEARTEALVQPSGRPQ